MMRRLFVSAGTFPFRIILHHSQNKSPLKRNYVLSQSNQNLCQRLKTLFPTPSEQLSVSLQWRFFSVNVADLPKISTYVENGTYKMTLLLPNVNEQCTFPLKLNETVRDLINDIRTEDPRINQIVLHYTDGLRVSHSTTIDDLLKSEFILTIDGTKYHVLPPKEKVKEGITENVLNVADLRNLMHKAYYQKIMQRLQNDQRHHMPYSEYLEWCREFGLSDEEALKLAQNLHEVGVILHFNRNPELRDFIFLRPKLVISTITNALQLRYIKKGDEEKLKELEEIKKELVPLNMLKEFYDRVAELFANRVLALIGIYLTIQFSVLARMVWIDFNWDIMEPVTYFVTFGTLIFGFAFFTMTKIDYSYPAFKERIIKRKLRALYLKNQFNWKKWNALYQRAKQLEDELNIENEKRITKSSEPTLEQEIRDRIEKIVALSVPPQPTPTV